ncbi:MAG: VanZ family protein [Xanthomonadales bacterium]|nr:VanZ family protein [Xanthomonadales bacterium]
MNAPLGMQRLWFATGLLMLLLIAVVSLIPIDQPLPIRGADKFEHVLAYFVLMYWWGMVQPGRLWGWLLFLPLFGLALELLQGLTPHRFMEWRDAAANTAGVLLGLVILKTPAARLLRVLDTKLGNRINTG